MTSPIITKAPAKAYIWWNFIQMLIIAIILCSSIRFCRQDGINLGILKTTKTETNLSETDRQRFIPKIRKHKIRLLVWWAMFAAACITIGLFEKDIINGNFNWKTFYHYLYPGAIYILLLLIFILFALFPKSEGFSNGMFWTLIIVNTLATLGHIVLYIMFYEYVSLSSGVPILNIIITIASFWAYSILYWNFFHSDALKLTTSSFANSSQILAFIFGALFIVLLIIIVCQFVNSYTVIYPAKFTGYTLGASTGGNIRYNGGQTLTYTSNVINSYNLFVIYNDGSSDYVKSIQADNRNTSFSLENGKLLMAAYVLNPNTNAVFDSISPTANYKLYIDANSLEDGRYTNYQIIFNGTSAAFWGASNTKDGGESTTFSPSIGLAGIYYAGKNLCLYWTDTVADSQSKTLNIFPSNSFGNNSQPSITQAIASAGNFTTFTLLG